MKTKGKRVCPVCGTLFPDSSESCPVCALQGALGAESGVSSIEDDTSELCFEHYRVLENQDGTPIELGHGAMGLTYKAVDASLRRTVALKVIDARFVGDESARHRFLREARAAASLRHPNVASVFHLGHCGDNYFYAMEFVEGETLDSLIHRCGRLEVSLALEIATQVTAGLTAVHKQKLVHRDIKPANIMVNEEEGGGISAKIIDLGLAKAVAEYQSERAISIPGSFAGTPEFASPEQFAGVGADIRSDLYSLGVTLWNMLAGQTPFRGSSAELMHRHLHATLPMEQLDWVPQPVVALLEVLLEKDPARRFQNPTELLKAMPIVIDAIDARRVITHQGLLQMPLTTLASRTRKPPVRLRPEKISVARLPITASQVFGREEEVAFLDAAWSDPQVNVVTVVAWAGVGKSTLVNHWLQRMATEHYRSAELIFGWSLYRQGTSGQSASADEFLNAALAWFGDPYPRIGTAWEKGERLARLVTRRRTLLILDGLEPLQNPPGPQEGRLREPSMQALLRELAAYNPGLCVITTRLPIADIADHERTSAPRRDLEQLSRDAGAKLLRVLGVQGDETELRDASDDFGGHCLALTLLGSYLTDAYSGNVRCRKEVSARLAHDVRQGAYARRVMGSYQTWFGEGPELAVLRMLGLFDGLVEERMLEALLKPPVIPGLTESLLDLSSTEWRTILAKLRRAKLLAGADPHNPGHLDTHPLVREYFGGQLQSQQPDAWKEGNRRLYQHYRILAPHLPNSFGEMEPLFLAVICGCNAGLFREALHEVYIPRIQRGNAAFAANVLGARGALLSVLCHFFEDGRWDSAVETGVVGQNLTAEDQLFILIQAALNLSATRGFSTPEARLCYERAESLCRSLDRPLLLYLALIGQWRYSLLTDSLSATMQIAKRVYSLAEEHNVAAFMVGACNALAATLYSLGDFENARQYAMRGVQVWSSGGAESLTEEVDAPGVTCLYFRALAEWHVGEVAASKSSMAEAISLANRLNDMHALVLARYHAAVLGVYERDPAEVERCASDLFELSTRQDFASHLSAATVLRGWARSVSGEAIQGISWIEGGIRDFRATGSILGMPFFLALKAEALHAAHRTSEALEAINEAERLVERSGQRNWCAELNRLRGLFLAATDASEAQIEASFSAAIRIAREQRSISLATRAEASHAEYRCQREAAVDPLTISLPTAKGLERSIAVLPFESLSDNRNDAYFADGVQDEILSRLAKVSQLSVISRTSVMAYRPGGNRDIRSIASALGVANLVEGSVRRDGNRVRITIRLVDARRDEALWSDSYDRDLRDIFAIQSDIAQKVAAKLTAQLSPKERSEIREKPTKDIEAYDLYLRARELIVNSHWFQIGDERESLLSAIRLLEEATRRDSRFALAFCLIARANDALYWTKIDQTPERRALADTAINEALRLRPDLLEVRLKAAWRHFVYRDDERTFAELAIVQRSLPNSSEAVQLRAFISRRQGRWEEAISALQGALSLDPRHPGILGSLGATYSWLRRYREVEQIYDRQLELAPNKTSLKAYRASVAFEEKADLGSYQAVVEKLPSATRNNLWITSLRLQNAVLARNWRDARKILSVSPHNELYFRFSPCSWANSMVPSGCHEIWCVALQRGRPTIETRFGSARDQLKQKADAQPEDAGLISMLGLIDGALGRKHEAIQEARRATEMLPISKDAVEGPPLVSNLAMVYAWASELDLAFQELTVSVKTPGGVHYGELKLDPAWDPLRKDPRYEKLLAELAPKD